MSWDQSKNVSSCWWVKKDCDWKWAIRLSSLEATDNLVEQFQWVWRQPLVSRRFKVPGWGGIRNKEYNQFFQVVLLWRGIEKWGGCWRGKYRCTVFVLKIERWFSGKGKLEGWGRGELLEQCPCVDEESKKGSSAPVVFWVGCPTGKAE